MTDLKPSLYWDDLEAGQEIATWTNAANEVQLLVFSAITWNPHRIHYDRDYAHTEGHRDIIVHGPLQGAWLSQYVTDWIGPLGRMKRLGWQNRGSAVVNETVSFTGRVLRKYVEGGEHLVDGEIVEQGSDGATLMPATFTVALPAR
jgi:hydroxyacyl-ACP dehydratase HTD2-like protein with hotdog domain